MKMSHLLRFTKYLSSALLAIALLAVSQTARTHLRLGTVQFSSVTAFDGKTSRIVPGVVVVALDKERSTRSFGLTNDVGILVMPLPPGQYTVMAYSQDGKEFTLESARKAFVVSESRLTEVGVEIKK